MKSLESEGLKIEAAEDNGKVTLTWKGKSRNMTPELILDPYFAEIIPNLTGKVLTVDFSQLQTMNSSTVPPILSFIRNLEEKQIQTEVKYDCCLGWQCASFIPLSTIIRNYKYVKIEAI